MSSSIAPQISSSVAVAPADGAPSIPAQAGRHFRRLGRNVLLKCMGETPRLFQMAFFVVAARRFGPAALGSLTALMMIGSGIGLLFGDLGINTTMIARMSGGRESERKGAATEALFWKNVLSALALLLMFGGMYLIRNSGSWTEVFAVATISLGGLWIEFLCALTNGVNRLDAEAWLRVVFRGAVYGGGALVALFVNLASDLVFMAVATIAVIVGAFLLIRRGLVPLSLSLRPAAGASLLKESVPVWVTQLAQLTFLKFDVVILGLLHVAARETGWYAAAWKIADVLTGVPAVLSVAALPLMGGSSPRTNVLAIAPKGLEAMYVLPFLFVLPLAIGAEWITRLLYGEGFAGTPRVLQILVWAVVPFFTHMFLAVVAVVIRRQSEAAKLAATTSILGMLAAVILVPRLGYEAMAVICLVANSVFACAMIYRFRDVTGSTQSGTGLKSLVSAMGVYGLCSVIPRGIHPVLMMVGGTAAYCIAMLLLKVISLRDLDRVWRLVASMLWNRPAGGVSPV